jgi:hypothetical protein
VEIVLLLSLVVVPYELLAVDGVSRTTEAVGHARDLLRLEQQSGIAMEAWLFRATAAHPPLMTLALQYYEVMHFLVPAVAALLLVLRARPSWPPMRTAFVVCSLAGIAVFWLYPVAPPNLVPDAGFTGAVTSNPAYPFGAMPSLHVAWALWAAAAVAAATSGQVRVAAGVLCGLHTALTVLVVLATGHHWVADVFGGVAVVGIGAAAAAAPGLRPRTHGGPASAGQPGH